VGIATPSTRGVPSVVVTVMGEPWLANNGDVQVGGVPSVVVTVMGERWSTHRVRVGPEVLKLNMAGQVGTGRFRSAALATRRASDLG
jgi:hypothetical protein